MPTARSEFELVGASTFPRHWVYDEHGALTAKAGMADFKDWWRHSFGKHTPWGDEDSPALVTAVETALERELAGHIMRGGAKSSIRKVKEGGLLTEQGSEGDDVFLLLNGVVSVEVDGAADRRTRTGGDPRRAGGTRGRRADIDASSAHQGDRRRREVRPTR